MPTLACNLEKPLLNSKSFTNMSEQDAIKKKIEGLSPELAISVRILIEGCKLAQVPIPVASELAHDLATLTSKYGPQEIGLLLPALLPLIPNEGYEPLVAVVRSFADKFGDKEPEV